MTTDLRPLTIGEVFDAAFDLYKRDFPLFCATAAIVAVPFNILVDMLTLSTIAGDEAWVRAHFSEVLSGMGVVAPLAIVFSYILQGTVVTVVASHRLLGLPIRTGAAYRQMGRRMIPLLVTWGMAGVAVMGIIMVISIAWFFGLALVVGMTASGAASAGVPQAGAAVVVVGMVIGCVLLAAAYAAAGMGLGGFLTQIITVEDGGYIAAILRNARLMRGRFLHLCAAGFLVLVIVTGLDVTLAQSVAWVLNTFVYTWLPVPVVAQHVVESVWSAVSSLLVQPYMFVLLTVLYYDQRVRREGLDLELLDRLVHEAVPVEAVG